MALSNLDKDNLTRLFQMINIDDYSDNQNALANIKKDYSNFGKLELIAKQISYLQTQAVEIYNNHQLSTEINEISCNFKKTPGTIYYLYEKNNIKFLSLISNKEWNSYDKFICEVLYDYDCNFKQL
ncbi:hypothetical protein PGAG_00089 [Phaeocystis globosa virus 12T]|uniref:Uncharacterized protein n=1 Tax=Phaeocystis globosa virus PgV-16T TaxID=3071227 RepID=A0AC59EWX3_9VIRU|nr:hypothetical protein PGCG_00129 [Phaeocystis globosa virus]AET72978.1 hypothetical protein PGAG_00089 [Phaeocystis globosa virus 12T]AET73799.1 hypothetical protein PGBG_00091 [Phaeocystis globosa virus 14T]AGM15441.1 hypothetical protein PGCG_00129 [Phaeocystis globosa virus PgV-16T]UYE94171.1 DUF2452 family protein [Phaeocystis globosa virus]